jgi:N-methylhydantoinase A/oxoprolinase/acetone carboxylase beta subunit
MESFLMGMQDALVALGVARTVMIIRGDATSMNIVDTHRQAASTVASGPAATACLVLVLLLQRMLLLLISVVPQPISP